MPEIEKTDFQKAEERARYVLGLRQHIVRLAHELGETKIELADAVPFLEQAVVALSKALGKAS